MRSFSKEKTLRKINESIRNPLIRNMAIVAIITFLIKALAFYKETIIASTFGLSEILDTFLVAALIPIFVQSVFLNSLKHLFIPNYIAELKINGNKSSFQSVIFLMTLGVSLMSIIIAYLFIDIFLEVLFPGQSAHYYNLVKNQFFTIY